MMPGVPACNFVCGGVCWGVTACVSGDVRGYVYVVCGCVCVRVCACLCYENSTKLTFTGQKHRKFCGVLHCIIQN